MDQPGFSQDSPRGFGINGIEFANTLFGVPTFNYLNELKKNADDYGVQMVLIMVDARVKHVPPRRKSGSKRL